MEIFPIMAMACDKIQDVLFARVIYMHLHIGLRFKLAIFNAKQAHIVYFGKQLFTIKNETKN